MAALGYLQTISGALFAGAIGPAWQAIGLPVPNQATANQQFLVYVDVTLSINPQVRITRSTDGVNFSPITVGNYTASRSQTGVWPIFEATAGVSYRIENLSGGGSCAFIVSGCDFYGNGMPRPLPVDTAAIGAPSPFTASMFSGSPTVAQLQSAYLTRWNPLTNAGIQGDLTAYKSCAGGAIAQLLIPAAVQRCLGTSFVLGSWREIRAQSANVVAITDNQGNSLSSATSRTDPNTVLVPGQTVTSYDQRNIYGRNSDGSFRLIDTNSEPLNTGSFTAPTYAAGLYCWPTLIEAATSYMQDSPAGPNLSALGL